MTARRRERVAGSGNLCRVVTLGGPRRRERTLCQWTRLAARYARARIDFNHFFAALHRADCRRIRRNHRMRLAPVNVGHADRLRRRRLLDREVEVDALLARRARDVDIPALGVAVENPDRLEIGTLEEAFHAHLSGLEDPRSNLDLRRVRHFFSGRRRKRRMRLGHLGTRYWSLGCGHLFFERRDLFPDACPLLGILSARNLRRGFYLVAIAEYRRHRTAGAGIVMRTQSRRQRLRIAGQAGHGRKDRTGLGGRCIDRIEHRERMIAQLERLRLGILREGLARTDSDRKQREQTNGRLDPPEDRSGTRYTRGGSMLDEIDHPLDLQGYC